MYADDLFVVCGVVKETDANEFARPMLSSGRQGARIYRLIEKRAILTTKYAEPALHSGLYLRIWTDAHQSSRGEKELRI